MLVTGLTLGQCAAGSPPQLASSGPDPGQIADDSGHIEADSDFVQGWLAAG
jgi:hypothetical protein